MENVYLYSDNSFLKRIFMKKYHVDVKNGFAVYETRSNYGGHEHLVRIEMCYWNFDDQKHKLFAYNYMCFDNGKYSAGQYDGLTLCKYDNAKKSMTSSETLKWNGHGFNYK